jgi:hypothetical protein
MEIGSSASKLSASGQKLIAQGFADGTLAGQKL